TAQGSESPADPFDKAAAADPPPESGTPPPGCAQRWSKYFQNVSVRLIEGALEKPGPAAATSPEPAVCSTCPRHSP
ncbi:hypothetical protein ABTE94_20265, partial [Acinetobacter baumannii]